MPTRCARTHAASVVTRLAFVACVAGLAPVTACAARTPATTTVGAGATTGGPARLTDEAERHWRGRSERDAIERAIAAWERAVASDPTARAAFVRLAEAHHFLGESMLAFGWNGPEAAAAAFAAGKRAADQALGLAPSEPDAPVEVAPSGADAAALYWRARNLWSWAAAGDYVREILVVAEIERALAAAAEADLALDRGGPDRALGMLYAAPPSFAMRNLDRARRHFERARTRAPQALATEVAEAGTLAVATQDRARFEAALRRVLEADPSGAPDLAPENRIAQARARALLARADELFE